MRINMNKAHLLNTLMMVWSLESQKDPFRPKELDKEILDLEVPYVNVIRVLMYLAQCTRLNITFAVNLLARFSFEPTRRHWNGIKHIFCYLQGTIDFELFYLKKITSSRLVEYTNA